MERRSDKHASRLDDEMRRETEALVRGSPLEARAEEFREHEGPGEGEPTPDAVVAGGHERFPGEEVSRRAELARRLPPKCFPGTREELLDAARSQGAPDAVVRLLESLPGGRYGTVSEVWVALGGSREHRGVS